MMESTLFDSIQELYHTHNVYKSVILGDDDERLCALHEQLQAPDYPVDPPILAAAAGCAADHRSYRRFLEHRTRMLLLSREAYQALEADLPMDECFLILDSSKI